MNELASEDDVRDGLAVAVADEPALRLDPDELIARGRQEVRRRRTLVAAGLITAVVAAGAVAVPLALRPVSPLSGTAISADHLSSRPPTAPTAPTSTTSTSPGVRLPWPPPNVVPVHYTAAQLNRRGTEMQNHLRTQFGKAVPGTTEISPLPFDSHASDGVTGGNFLDSMVRFTRGGAQSAMAIAVYAPGSDGPKPVTACSFGTVLRCDAVPRDDGSTVVIEVTRIDQNLRGGVLASATHYRTNGSVVGLTGYNYDPSGRGRIVLQPDVTVGIDELVALATDPALGI